MRTVDFLIRRVQIVGIIPILFYGLVCIDFHFSVDIDWYQGPAHRAPPVDDAMETPLDVLSRAATLIHDQLHKSKTKKNGKFYTFLC